MRDAGWLIHFSIAVVVGAIASVSLPPHAALSVCGALFVGGVAREVWQASTQAKADSTSIWKKLTWHKAAEGAGWAGGYLSMAAYYGLGLN